jgi:alkylation response protein AidB-like acyl-CoA dehydrogenase
VDLELSDEQTWLAESVETLLAREWTPAAEAPYGDEAQRHRLWRALVDFGALTVGGDDGLGAVELCLIGRGLGAHLAPVPYLASAAVRYAIDPLTESEDAFALALLEPGSGWASPAPRTTIDPTPVGDVLNGCKVGLEHATAVQRLAVAASGPDGAALAIVKARAPGVALTAQPAFDATVPVCAVDLAEVEIVGGPFAGEALRRLSTIGALMAAAEAVGAAGRLLDDACRYAGERRQFGHTVGSFQALRHLMADMYVRQASSWSSVLYAAAALDEEAVEAGRTASIAKAYVSRAAREVAHGAMQVFGGIAVTAEHPAHRFLRRIVVREQQFGDAAHHERALGRALAADAVPEPVV